VDFREAMQRAVTLAWSGWGRVGRNPLVGAVVLRNGAVVGEGYHAEFGGPHGEVLALVAAGERARGADLVVTLEPCAHHGKTPPCADAIVSAGIRRVVFAAADVDPMAKGGAEVLRGAGVEVQGGLLEGEALAQNAQFFHRFTARGRPFVALKLAVSLDARIADRDRHSQWISGPESREYAHWLRAGFEAIGVGAGTVLADDPALTPRGPVTPLRPPLRVVFDRRGRVRPSAAVVQTAGTTPTLLLLGPGTAPGTGDAFRAAGAEVVVADGPAEDLAVLERRGIASLLVEGGGVLAGSLLGEDLVDRLYLITAPLFLGELGSHAFAGLAGAPLAEAARWRTVARRALGADTLLVLDRR
jgi:diaminohydroxyphosphoribosylaminopyrimidine deaminase / 5-amino-6-(5-phosphoribosylamino)uracil reductase